MKSTDGNNVLKKADKWTEKMIVLGESPTQKGFVMNLLSVSERTKSIEKIAISNMKQAFFEICNTLLTLKLLLFYELEPVLNMVTYNIRSTEDVAVTVMRFLLKDSDSIKIPDSLLKDAIEWYQIYKIKGTGGPE